MRAWVYQAANQLTVHGAKKAPWSVGWYDQCGKKKQKTIGTKTAANQYARKLEGESAAGLLKSHERVKWAEFVTRFDEDHLSTLRPRSRKAYSESIAKFTAKSAPAYVDQVDAGLVDKFRAARLRDGVQPATVNRDLRHLRCALKKARKWGLLPAMIEIELLREPERDPEFIDDDAFQALYNACESMTLPAAQHYSAKEWWQALLVFAYMTGWRIGEITALRRDQVDFANGVATLEAEKTKGGRDIRIELHPAVIEHLKTVVSFELEVFHWPYNERTLWDHFAKLKKAAGVEFKGAFHRLRFGFCNANVDRVDEDVLQHLMRHRDRQTTRRYVHVAKRMQRQGTADKLHVPAILAKKA